MNFSVFMSPPASARPVRRQRGYPQEIVRDARAIRNLSLTMLKRHGFPRQGLPLDIHVTSTTLEDDHVVYHATMESVVTKHKWVVSYRYSEFLTFKNQVDELFTCHSSKCSGSCQAIRDFLQECFPKKRLVGSTSDRVVHDRKRKLEIVLLHLLRCVLLPGSAMKCATARHSLCDALYAFLGVEDDQDRRSLLQIFVDTQNEQGSSGGGGLKRSSQGDSSTSLSSMASTNDGEEDDEEEQDEGSSAGSPSTSLRCPSFASTWSYEDDDFDSKCVICLDDLDEDHEHCQHQNQMEESESDSDSDPRSSFDCVKTMANSNSVVKLPCHHAFHRACIFEWLLFEFHCPLCRSRIGPNAVTNYCQPKGRTQWWLGEFDEDPLGAAAASTTTTETSQ